MAQFDYNDLSSEAVKLYNRLCDGRYYMDGASNTPKAMKELIKAGLVVIAGRYTVMQACFVPSQGYEPATSEDFSGCVKFPPRKAKRALSKASGKGE